MLPRKNRKYVPLQFWFCRNPGLALPLIALQYHEVKLAQMFNEASWSIRTLEQITLIIAVYSVIMSSLILMKEEDLHKFHTNTLLNKFNIQIT